MVKHRKLRPEEKQQKSFAGHIREFFNENFRAFYNPRQIARKVGAKNEMQKREVAELLDGMVKEGFLLQESPGRYRRQRRRSVPFRHIRPRPQPSLHRSR